MMSSKITLISRQLTKNSLFNIVKHQSTQVKRDLVLVDVNDKTGMSVVTLNSPPVNTLSLELLSAFAKTLDELERSNSRGMILTSSSPTVFSAGLDINEMHKPDKDRVRNFWRTLQDVWIKLYGSSFPTAAAINGHAPAGGCLLSMCCEYRAMLPKYTIGLNETKLGLVAPPWFVDTMKNTISASEAEDAVKEGRMFKTEEALKIGLIDDIVGSKAEAIDKCQAFLSKYDLQRGVAKQSSRKLAIATLKANREPDIDIFVGFINDPKVQSSLGKYIALLKWKRRMKPLTTAAQFVQGLFGGGKKKKTA